VVPEARARRREERVVVVEARVEKLRERGEALHLEVEELHVALRPAFPPRGDRDPPPAAGGSRRGGGEAVQPRWGDAALGPRGLERVRGDAHAEDAPPPVVRDAVEEERAVAVPRGPPTPRCHDGAAGRVGRAEHGHLRLQDAEVERPGPVAV